MTAWRANLSRQAVYKPGLWSLAFASAALVILELVLPIVTMQIYDRVLPHQARATLGLLLGAAAIALFLESAIRLARARLVAFSGFSMSHRLGQDLIAASLKGSSGATDAQAVGHQMHTINSLGALRDFFSGHSTVTLMELALIPILIGAIGIIAGWVALVPGLLLVAFMIVLRWRTQDLLQAMEQRDASDGDRYDYIVDTLSEIHSVKALALEQHLARDYERLKGKSIADGYDASTKLLAMFDVSALFSSLIILGTIIAGAYAALLGNITAGGLVACILLAGRIMQPVRKALSLHAQRQDYQIASERVDALLATYRPKELPPDDQITQNSGVLNVDGLSIGYKEDAPLIEGVSFQAEPGDVVLIDGPAGCGKSTFLRAIVGDHAVQNGSVKIGGVRIHDLEASQKNRLVGYMPEEGEIYRGTIAENLTRFGETPFAGAMYLVHLLEFADDIARLPAGMETRLEGTGADPIPPGLKQRVSFGRSLALRPKLIVFDSADTGLDRTSYEALFTLFCKLKSKATILLVTDDVYLKSLATRQCEIKGGKLVERPKDVANTLQVRNYREVRA